MSEEKMLDSQWQQAGWIAGWILRHNLTAAIANSATAFVELQDHLAALQAGAVAQPIAYLYRDDEEMLFSSGRCVVYEENQEFSLSSPQRFKPLYLASPSAQAIETAAIMRCVEEVRCFGRLTDGEADVKEDLIAELISLIPKDGRTQVKSEDARDAARYRHVRSGILNCSFIVRQARYDGKWVEMGCDVLDEAIDADIRIIQSATQPDREANG